NLGKDLSSSDKRDTRRELFEEKTRIEEESLESSKETLGLILESERIGVKTGRELVRQRETLNRVEDKLESIDGSLHETQKHIKSMKSIFSGFGGMFSKKRNTNNNSNKSSNKNEFLEEINNFEIKATNSLTNINSKSESNKVMEMN
ncbi:unnamed protein product, partial [Oppiella nova]